VAIAPRVAGDVTYEQSETAFLEGRYDEAVDLFTQYTERRESNPWGHYMLGMSAWKSGRYETAETAFRRAVELDTTLVKGYLNLGRVLLEASRPTEALGVADRALAVGGEASAVYRLKGRAYHTLGQSADAVAAYRQAIGIDAEDAWSMNNLAFILIEEGRYDEALPALARATELRKDVAVFFNNLGMALECTGHFRGAEEAYTLAVSLEGASPKAIANRDRVAGVKEQPGLVPADLVVLARAFEAEVGSWRGSPVATADVRDDETLVPSPSDTTATAQQPK
jgi:Flp pilus assembly protein TadD